MSDLRLLVNTRKFTRKLVTENYNKRLTFVNLSALEKSSLKVKLTDCLSKLKDLDSQIQNLKWATEQDESKLEEEFTACEDYSDKIRDCLINLESIPVTQSSNSSSNNLKPPTAPLPCYSSKENEDFTKFILQFEDVINKYNYSEYEKLLLLKQQITGRALFLIDSLESDNQGYSQAKSLLEKALASADVQKFNTIKLLSELKLDNCEDPFQYISKMKTIKENFRKLKLSTDNILQYFFWEGLNNPFQRILVSITNHTLPSLDEIMDHFFTACERYTPKSHRKKESTSNFAVKVSVRDEERTFKYFPCSLCSTDKIKADHSIKRCEVYPNPKSKIDQLRKINGCTKCGFTNHNNATCSYRFKENCSNCKGYHWSHLCIANIDKNKGAIKKEHKAANHNALPKKKNVPIQQEKMLQEKENSVESGNKTQNNVSIVMAQRSTNEGETILPTFTCKVKGKKIRGMKDGGCQSNFLTTDVANSLNLSVIDNNVELIVKGINTPKVYKTKMVEVEIEFDGNIKVIQALCTPSLDISLKIPNLNKVVDGFLKKGHNLADEMLLDATDEISDIHLILGSKSSYCIPEKEILFGQDNQSLYSETFKGIMLKGDVSKLIADIPYLPFSENSMQCLPAVVNHTSRPNHCMQNKKFCLVSNSSLKSFPDKNINVLDDNGEIIEQQLLDAASEILESTCGKVIHKDQCVYNDDTIEVNNQLIEFVFQKTSRTEDGRLKMPVLWNPRVSHLLGNNFTLSKNILVSSLRKLRCQDDIRLQQIDNVFKEQEEMGIIERIENLEQFVQENPVHSFLPFMAIFKPQRETTKTRVVFLSNLSERNTMSHNQCIQAGPSVNQKLSSSLLHLRFGSKLCCFDLKKAFNQIELEGTDQNRLLFLWFRNISKEDFSIVAYKNIRLPFGLRCSPTILMLGMFKMLVADSHNDPPALNYLKNLIYQLSYMDNCAICAETSEELNWMYDKLKSIFSPYKFEMQQFITNDTCLQSKIDEELCIETPSVNKVFGLSWERIDDKLSTKPINLDERANTKRKILSTIASQFDILNFNGPLMNRARIFMHQLQCQKELDWDEALSSSLFKEWTNIAKQANSAPPIEIERSFGARQDNYELMAYADSSKLVYGVVVYLLNLNNGKISFVLARNRLVNKQLESKTIPSLELLALSLAAETIDDLKEELSGPSCIDPINIVKCEVFSDSLVALNWLNSYALKMDKCQRKSAFVLNRLEKINKICENRPIRFSFVSGESNPADCITRPLSYKQLMKTNYISGQSMTGNLSDARSAQDFMSFVIPGSAMKSSDINAVQCLPSASARVDLEHLASVGRASSFARVGRVVSLVLKFIDKVKVKLRSRNPEKFGYLETHGKGFNYFTDACALIIRIDQEIHFPEVFSYFKLKHKTLKSLPNIVRQLNLYLDQRGLIRVKSKCENMKIIKKYDRYNFPLLISKSSPLANLIIKDYHERLSHGGCYSVLAEIRKQFWIPHIYSLVKKLISSCIPCKRMNARPIKLNQSPYREERLDPVNVPFRQIYMDYMGPFVVKNKQKQNMKTWILCITCMWSRAINLKLCMDLTTEEFLRSFQLHCYEFGIPSYCVSDLGSQLVSGSNIITSFLSDHESILYLQENNINSINFEQYFKGHSQLGSLVESCVKLTKRLLHGSVKNNILDVRDFEFMVCKTTHLVNRRPIAFKECLRDTTGEEIPEIVTPEMLIHGRSLASINVIPYLQSIPNPEWCDNIPSAFEKLQKVRHNLIKLYNEEFIGKLIYQAINKENRYKPVNHQKVSVGDIILLKEPHAKPHNYPLARVKEVVVNSNGEVTGVVAVKGKNREVVKRHSSTVIPLLSIDSSEAESEVENDSPGMRSEDTQIPSKGKRKAAINSEIRTRQILLEDD